MLNGSGVKIFTGMLDVSTDAEVVIAHDEQVPAIQSWQRSSPGGMNQSAGGLHILNEFQPRTVPFKSRSDQERNRGDQCPDRGKRAGDGRVHHQHRVRGSEYCANGTLHYDTCLQDSKRKKDHCGIAFISLC